MKATVRLLVIKVFHLKKSKDDNAGELIDIMVDLGVPDYGYKHFYILIKSENKNSEIYFRRSLIELKD